LKTQEKNDQESIWCYSNIEEVKQNMYATNYPKDNIVFIKGRVEDTLPSNIIGEISLLRLDTDWYESTRCEMNYLYPKLSLNGVLIIDDYGHWMGAKKAIDEYFEQNGIHLLLNNIDYTGRICIKIKK
jgi:O-methyltransferase